MTDARNEKDVAGAKAPLAGLNPASCYQSEHVSCEKRADNEFLDRVLAATTMGETSSALAMFITPNIVAFFASPGVGPKPCLSMSQTRIICPKCGKPLAYCSCNIKGREEQTLDKT